MPRHQISFAGYARYDFWKCFQEALEDVIVLGLFFLIVLLIANQVLSNG